MNAEKQCFSLKYSFYRPSDSASRGGRTTPSLPPSPKLQPFLYLRENNVRVLDTDYNRQQAMLIRIAVMVTNIHTILVSFRVC
jgi:hypothetical protein